MHKVKFKPTDALKEHLLSGGEVSILEAYVVFGVQNINAELGRLKKTGFIVKHRRVPMAKIIRRTNEVYSEAPLKPTSKRNFRY